MAQKSPWETAIPPTIYTGTFVDVPDPEDLRIRHGHALGVDSAGVIRFICEEAQVDEVLQSDEVLRREFSDGETRYRRLPTDRTSFLFPGFVDTHTHAPQYPNTGLLGSTTLLDWLEKYTCAFSIPPRYPLCKTSQSSSILHVHPQVINRSLSNGTTTAAYHATLHVPSTQHLASTCYLKGQRALIGRVCMDTLSPPHYLDKTPDAAVEASESVIAHCATLDPTGEKVRGVVTPRFAPSCSAASLRALGDLVKQKQLWTQTHVSENLDELARVKEMFPHSRDYVSVYDDCGLLNERTILAHGIHLSNDEVAMIKERGAGISHCPISNTALASGEARVRTLMERGVKVGLGTDVSGGWSLSVKVSWVHCFEMRVSSLGDEIGQAYV
ncbi:MAG: hypothetical protein Q9162_002284 [Coniocarpon cinnabarinum]